MKNSAPDAGTYSSFAVSQAIFAALLGAGFEAQITLPASASIVGHRVLLIEHDTGDSTGRAALYRIDEVTETHSKMMRTWNWTHGKFDDDLAFLGLKKVSIV